jgi:hypothetical protein
VGRGMKEKRIDYYKLRDELKEATYLIHMVLAQRCFLPTWIISLEK